MKIVASKFIFAKCFPWNSAFNIFRSYFWSKHHYQNPEKRRVFIGWRLMIKLFAVYEDKHFSLNMQWNRLPYHGE